MAKNKTPKRQNKKPTASPSRRNVAATITPSSARTSNQLETFSKPLNRLLVGGQLLGNRTRVLPGVKNIVASWDTFEPIITPSIPQSELSRKKSEQRYVLLPHDRYITVLAYKTGAKVGTLVPIVEREENSETQNEVVIECVSLVKYSRKVGETTVQDVIDAMDIEGENENFTESTTKMVEETLVMVGCRDGSVREFSLKELGKHNNTTEKQADVGPFQVSGPCFRPRRIIRVANNTPIMQMTVPHLRTPQVRKDGILMYLATQRKDEEEKDSHQHAKTKTSSFRVDVIRVLLPHYAESEKHVETSLSEESIRSLHKFKCKAQINKKKKLTNTLPFRMLSVANTLSESTDINTNSNCSIHVVLAKANEITIYYDQLESSQTFPPISISMPSNNPLTAASISLNKADITCGHYRGNIRVLNNILSDIETYHMSMQRTKQLGGENRNTSLPTSNMPADPRKNMITSRVHWHALPITSIVYDSMSYHMDPLLYSGGDESVLVTWQISQGRDRPVNVHPRLALGGIIHLSSSDRCDDKPENGILVYCEDNTLQLLASHDKGCMWKIQGLACGQNEDTTCSVQTDPLSDGRKNSHLVMTGLNQAPGYIHWFDPTRERIASSLEVVPFNRISRNEPEDRPLPKPQVTGHVFSKSGDDLITIDESETENVYIGAREIAKKEKDQHGLVSTIRFWAWNDASSVKGDFSPPYHEVASMTYPHGPKNRVSAVNMSNDGTYACTMSCGEKAFRVWEKSTSWACRYKVKVPAGISNCTTTKNGLTFSDDNSLLAIAFGKIGTIWDTDGARLLSTFDHSQGNSDIELIRFISPGLHQDLILVQSKTCVSLRSPYGPYGSSQSFQGWSWSIPQAQTDCQVTVAEYIESQACVAVAMYSVDSDQSRIVLIDIDTGEPIVGAKKKSLCLIENVNGCISSLCASGKQRIKSNWGSGTRSQNGKKKPPLALYALTKNGDLLLITEDMSHHNTTVRHLDSHESTGPRLEINSGEESRRKRQRTSSFNGQSSATESLLRPRKLALDIFGYGTRNNSSVVASTSELPSLSANFVKSFVGRNLRKMN